MKMGSELDELEKILKEKVEKDPEWDLLEIKSVRPIYLGELNFRLPGIHTGPPSKNVDE